MNIKLIRNFFLGLAIVLLAGLVGYNLGTNEVKIAWGKYTPNISVVNKLPPNDKAVDFALFWNVWDKVQEKYVDKTKLDTQKMVYGAISGMVAAIGDPYTVFLPPKQNQETKEGLNGSFEGIGAQLAIRDGNIVVAVPLPDSPAQRAGIKIGDFIIKVDGKDTAGWTLPEAVAKIRGPKGSKVVLNILHSGASKPEDVAIIRSTITLKSVEWEIASSTASGAIKPAIHLKLTRFGDVTDPQWDLVVNEISGYLATSSGQIAGLVLDVRNNPGGYLAGSVYTGSEFLGSGVIVKQQNYTGEVQTYSVDRKGKLLSVPVVVLVNQGTASAGEILAGALQVAGRAKVVGMQTFGKGSVQEAQDLSGGAGLHVTTAKWLLSNDVWVNGVGLTPDIKIENDDKLPGRDLQLEKAIGVLNGK